MLEISSALQSDDAAASQAHVSDCLKCLLSRHVLAGESGGSILSHDREWQLLELIPQIAWVAAPDGRLTYVNKRGQADLGESSAELLGRSLCSVIHPDDVEQARQVWQLCLQHGTPCKHEYRIRLAEGNYRWFLSQAAPLKRPDGSILEWVGIWADINDRREMEAHLREHVDLLRAVTEETTDAVFVKDRAGRYLLFNNAAARFVGREVSEVLGCDDTSLFNAEDARRVRELDQSVMKSGHAETQEEVLSAAGITRTYLSTKAPYRDADGNVLGIIGIARDITARRQKELELRAEELRLKELVSFSPSVLFTLDIKHQRIQRIGWISENLRDLLGYEPADACHPDWWLRNIHPDDRERIVSQTHDHLFSSGRASFEYRFRHHNGSYLWTRGEIRLIHGADGQVSEAVGCWSDITERKLLEEQFRTAQRMESLGLLAGGIAHDFNNLLSIISGYSDLLLTDPDIPAEKSEFISEIMHAGERATALTRQLLAFSRKQVLEPVQLDLNAVIRKNELILSRLLGEDTELILHLADGLKRVKTDPSQLEQLLLNLVVNARDAMPYGGRLTISTENITLTAETGSLTPELRAGPFVRLTLRDTGCGMDAATRAQIFEPFYTTKSVGRGTGLGLAMVFGFVTQSGGTIDVQSEPGQGATFTILLPALVEKRAQAGSQTSRSAMPYGAESILLVEDEPAVRALAAQILSQCGYQVSAAQDGTEALKILQQESSQFDMLLTDVVMPRMGGRELAERVQELRPKIKVLFFSGYANDAILRHGVSVAEMNFLQKPFTGAALTRKVRSVLDADA